jgi:hypothetical protein
MAIAVSRDGGRAKTNPLDTPLLLRAFPCGMAAP